MFLPRRFPHLDRSPAGIAAPFTLVSVPLLCFLPSWLRMLDLLWLLFPSSSFELWCPPSLIHYILHMELVAIGQVSLRFTLRCPMSPHSAGSTTIGTNYYSTSCCVLQLSPETPTLFRTALHFVESFFDIDFRQSVLTMICTMQKRALPLRSIGRVANTCCVRHKCCEIKGRKKIDQKCSSQKP